MTKFILFALALALASPLYAQSGLPHLKNKNLAPSSGDVNLRVTVKLRAKELSRDIAFVVQEGSQSNYVSGGEQAYDLDTSKGLAVEFKKTAAIVNCLAVMNPNKKNRARAECQFELSGSVKSKTSQKERDLETLQLQTGFEAELGKPVALLEEPERRIEVMIELAP